MGADYTRWWDDYRKTRAYPSPACPGSLGTRRRRQYLTCLDVGSSLTTLHQRRFRRIFPDIPLFLFGAIQPGIAKLVRGRIRVASGLSMRRRTSRAIGFPHVAEVGTQGFGAARLLTFTQHLAESLTTQVWRTVRFKDVKFPARRGSVLVDPARNPPPHIPLQCNATYRLAARSPHTTQKWRYYFCELRGNSTGRCSICLCPVKGRRGSLRSMHHRLGRYYRPESLLT
jgi:hypothetical protein